MTEENLKQTTVGIIPARYASSRFPGKPLMLLGGKTIIEVSTLIFPSESADSLQLSK